MGCECSQPSIVQIVTVIAGDFLWCSTSHLLVTNPHCSHKLASNMSTYLSPQIPGAMNYAELALGSPPPSKEPYHEGCFPCRWRKKKCKFIPLDQVCVDCDRFNIRCIGAGLEKPTVRFLFFIGVLDIHFSTQNLRFFVQGRLLAETIRSDLQKWISGRHNRALEIPPFDVAHYYEPIPPPTLVNFDTTATATPRGHYHRDASSSAFNRPMDDYNYSHISMTHQPHAYNIPSLAVNGDPRNTLAGMQQPSPVWPDASDCTLIVS